MSSTDPTVPELPLSPAQQEMWLAQQLLAPIPLAVAQYLDLRGPFDPDVYVEACRRAARDLGAYRRFVDRDGVIGQVVDTGLADSAALIDLSADPEPHSAALTWMRTDQAGQFDPLTMPPISSAILRLGADRHLLYTRAHHLALDGYGATRLQQRAAEHYVARLDGRDPAPAANGTEKTGSSEIDSATVLSVAQADYENSMRYHTDRAYWADRLVDLPEPATLATRTGDPDPLPLILGTDLAPDLVAALNERSGSGGNAPVVVAAFAAYLARMSGTDEVTLSLPMTARTTAAMRRSAGMIANVVPVRAPGTGTIAAVIDAARRELGGALRHQRYRGADMLRDAGFTSTATGFGPAVNIMNFRTGIELGAAQGTLHLLCTGPVADLALNVYPGAGRLRIELELNRNRYSAAEASAHLGRFTEFLTAFGTADPSTEVAALPVLTAAETGTLVPWRGPTPTTPATLAELIEDAVAVDSDATAVVFGDTRWTYREFDAHTNRLARALLAVGAGPEVLVAMVLERSDASVAAIWAITRTGSGFVPIDPGYPPERIAHILSDCGAPVGVTTAALRPGLPDEIHWLIIDSPTATSEYDSTPITAPERPATPRSTHPAYLIYTSGSTGAPKGVLVTHGGLANLAAERRDRYQLTPGRGRTPRVLHHASPGFDMAVGEILCGIAGAGTLVVAGKYQVAGPDLSALIRRENITNAIITPAVLATLDPADVPGLRVLGVGGEAIRADLVDAWAPNRLMRNGYGPTEATDIGTIAELVPGRPVTIGAPLRGFHALVLDHRLRPVPPGVTGELYLGGPALARGYHRKTALTSARFVADPFGPPGGRLYRTGDLVTITLDAQPELIYHGRSDFQIKVRGHRIEPGEIETALTALPEIAAAAVTAHQDSRGTHLVAYLVAAYEHRLDLDAVRDRIAATLPKYLRPSAYLPVPELPRTANGKLDTRRLPAPTFGRDSYIAPATAAEQAVADAFRAVLGTDRADTAQIGTADDFFALGGTSLSATRVAARLGVTVRTVFDAPTVGELSRRLDQGGGDTGPVAGTRPERLAPAPAQLRMWLLNQLYPESPAYHLPIAVRLSGPLRTEALAAAVGDLIDRHEVLRTTYPSGDHPGSGTEPRLRIHSPDEALLDGLAPVEVRSDHAVPDAVIPPADRDIEPELRAFAAQPFDLTRQLPFRVRLFRLGADEHVLMLVVHHIATDGWSLGPLVTDLTTAYAARSRGLAPDWEPLRVQYADYTAWQQHRLGDRRDPRSLSARQLAYWTRTLADAPDRLALPVDRIRIPGTDGTRGAALDFTIDPTTAKGVAEVARRYGVTPYMVTCAVYLVLLHQASTEQDVVIGTATAGRTHPAVEPLIGMFVNTLPVRATIDPAEPFDAVLARARTATLAALDHADVPFDHIVEAVNPRRDDTRNPLFQTVFSYENLPAATVSAAFGEVRATVLDIEPGTTHFDLALTLREIPEQPGYTAIFRYATDLFDRGTVGAFADEYVRLLRALVADPSVPIAEVTTDSIARQRLRAPVTATPDHALPPARATAREQAIARVFAAVLDRPAVAVDENFFDLGGTSLLVFTVRGELRAQLGLDVEPRLLFDNPTPRALVAALDATAEQTPERWVQQLSADCVLDPAITVPGGTDRRGPALDTVLLTGATGFVGAHLLAELLERTSATVYCLVRAADAEAGRARLAATLARYELPGHGLDRVVPVLGDLAEPRLGLTESMFDELAATVDTIVHNGARVNHLEPYEALRAANVAGTVEVLRLAAQHCVSVVHFVSTVSAAVGTGHDSATAVTEVSVIGAEQVPQHGYLASKWVAEQLVRAAGERGLPVVVHRPGLVSGATSSGVIPEDDSFWTLIRTAAHLGVCPDLGDAQVTLAPADYIARAIVTLATTRSAHGQTYHLVNSAPTKVTDIVDVVRAKGYRIDMVDTARAADLLADRVGGLVSGHADLLRSALLAENFLGGAADLLVTDARTRPVLVAAGLTCPAIDTAVLDRYVTGFVTAGLLPAVA
ncbi:non-ribosomal peptide synthetase [Nocardia uniformis]|uniref:Non-ribosomal peptide synthetase n=1 Tax=Nocardia uniformis TaxID=53432 RepID=A0A849C6F6_9NOCA|nr:non-ribosomal peptide synthetase [Nocardia uniformis]NNH70469.1 non-ribosomal peptide synthetase [Nocardia uniformis]